MHASLLKKNLEMTNLCVLHMHATILNSGCPLSYSSPLFLAQDVLNRVFGDAVEITDWSLNPVCGSILGREREGEFRRREGVKEREREKERQSQNRVYERRISLSSLHFDPSVRACALSLSRTHTTVNQL